MTDKLSSIHLKSDRIRELEQERLVLLAIIKQQGSYELSSDSMWEIISHELRTPLVPILGYVDLLLADKLSNLDDKQIQRLKIVQSNTKSIIELVNKIIESRSLDAVKSDGIKT